MQTLLDYAGIGIGLDTKNSFDGKLLEQPLFFASRAEFSREWNK